MPIILNFLKFAGGGLLRLAPLLFSFSGSLFTKISKNKFLKQHGFYILALLGFLYIIYTREENQLLSDVKGDPQRKATLLGRYFGTSKGLSWWQPSTWHEDEDSAFDLLMNSKGQIRQIELAYEKEVTDGRSLRSDIETFMNINQIDTLYAQII